MQNYLISRATGITAKGIKGATLKTMLLVIPPIMEQQVIMKYIDNLLGIIDKLEEQTAERKEKTEDLMQVVLQEAFEGSNHD